MAIGPIFGVSPYRAINTLNSVNKLLERSLERIGSGLRVNRAADDPAGSAVAVHFSSQARSGRQAIRNINSGIAMAQVAEGAMSEVGNILDRMRELAVQSSSGTLTSSQRASIDDEFEDGNELFSCMDHESNGEITLAEFRDGLQRMRGTAKAKDFFRLQSMLNLRWIFHKVSLRIS